MSVTTYQNHPLRSTVKQILNLANDAAFSEVTIANNEQHAYARDKIFGVTRLIDTRFNQTPAALVSQTGLNNLNANLQGAASELNAFISDKNPARLLNTTTTIDPSIMPLLWAFSPQGGGEDLPSIAAIVDDLRSSAQLSIAGLNEAKAALENELVRLASQIQAQEAKLTSLGEAVATQKAEALAVTAQVQKEFAEAEAARSLAFKQKMENLEEEFLGYEEGVQKEAQALIESLHISRNEAARIVEVVGNTGLTGNYQKIANDEKGSANIWRWITVALFGVGIFVALATFWKFLHEPFSPESAWSALIRLLYAIAITSPAWYAAKESARHRTNAELARKTELELASLGPFIELMPEDKKHEIKEELVKKYFGSSAVVHPAPEPANLKDVKELVEAVIKAASK